MLRLKHPHNIYERWYNRVKLEHFLFATVDYKELLKNSRRENGPTSPNSSIQYSTYTDRMNEKKSHTVKQV